MARAEQKKRGSNKRNIKKVIYIGTEGKNKTETNYFSNMGKQFKSEYVVRFANGNRTNPVGIVKNIIVCMKKDNISVKEGDIVYCVFDTDTDISKQEQINDAIEIADKNNIKIILSNPCFEVWFLQHFRYSTKEFLNNNEVLNELKTYIHDYEKNKSYNDILMDKTMEAITNAKRLDEFHKEQKHKENSVERNPSTKVYEIVEKFI